MVGDLRDRTAIVTGASRGIGLAIATSLLNSGARVVMTSRTREDVEAAAAALDRERAAGFAAHAADAEGAEACIAFALERFGSVDILVNNAGSNPAFGPVLDQDHERFTKTIDTNVWAPILWTQAAWRGWMSEHGGTVVNTASLAGLTVSPNLGVYHLTKAALIHLTKQLALELAPKVRVNAVAPGIVRTRLSEVLWKDHEADVAQIMPLGRIGVPADVGGAVAFFASDHASWITGETLVIDGGQLLRTAQPEGAV